MFLFFFVSASQCTSSILKKRGFHRTPIPTLSLSTLESGSNPPTPPPPQKRALLRARFPAEGGHGQRSIASASGRHGLGLGAETNNAVTGIRSNNRVPWPDPARGSKRPAKHRSKEASRF